MSSPLTHLVGHETVSLNVQAKGRGRPRGFGVRKVLVLVGAAAILLTWQITGVANASRAETERTNPAAFAESNDAMLAGISEAELRDMQTLATQRELPIDTVVNRYGWNNDFALGLTQLRAATADSFAASGILGSERAWVGFAEEAPDAADEFVAAFQEVHPNVVVELRSGLGFSEKDIDRLVQTVHYSLVDADHVADAATWFDWDERTVVANVGSTTDDARSLTAALTETAARAVADADLLPLLDRASISVSVTETDRVSGDENSNEHRGGEALNGTGDCTSGFIVGDGSGDEGPVTAAHCPNSLSDDGASLTYIGGHNSTHGDVQWHTGPQPENNTFYAGSSTSLEVDARSVTEVAAPTVGQTLCTNGRTTKKHCQEVRKLGVCSGQACNLVQMGEHSTDGGDSGGPVFFGTTAYGIHKGMMYDPAWPYSRGIFSRADRLPDALGVAVVK